ncbi:response regulator [Mesorhizobium sp. B2-1-8]|uniref:response regulator n=1 Tax=Mesorhizobium sp. B2-1-8 TaxID=2589967 RepID=UPI001129E9A1|nr:response regulator [Mesorhizobium sp. B2-1-8]UCI21963.1 response regulator [Mesorhizobium sp. B2-1-8]
MKVLLVEDEEHKTADLTERLLAAGVAEGNLEIAQGVKEAVLKVGATDFGLIVLDMALPTFSKDQAKGGEGGVNQAVGGMEVLRALKACSRNTRIIVVTQYPDVIISGDRIKLNNIPRLISQKYGQTVVGAILYSYKSPDWEAAFDSVMERIK